MQLGELLKAAKTANKQLQGCSKMLKSAKILYGQQAAKRGKKRLQAAACE